MQKRVACVPWTHRTLQLSLDDDTDKRGETVKHSRGRTEKCKERKQTGKSMQWKTLRGIIKGQDHAMPCNYSIPLISMKSSSYRARFRSISTFRNFQCVVCRSIQMYCYKKLRNTFIEKDQKCSILQNFIALVSHSVCRSMKLCLEPHVQHNYTFDQ